MRTRNLCKAAILKVMGHEPKKIKESNGKRIITIFEFDNKEIEQDLIALQTKTIQNPPQPMLILEAMEILKLDFDE